MENTPTYPKTGDMWATGDHQSFRFLFRLRQFLDNCSKLIEYLVPAL